MDTQQTPGTTVQPPVNAQPTGRTIQDIQNRVNTNPAADPGQTTNPGQSYQYNQESLEGATPDAGQTAQVSTTPAQNTPQQKRLLHLRNKDTSKLLFRVIGTATAVIVLLAGAGLLAGRFSDNRAVDPVQSVNEQELSSLQASTASTLPVESNGSTLFVNGNVLATQSLQVQTGDNFGQIGLNDAAGNQTYTLPADSGTFCLDSNNCNFLQSTDIGNGLAVNGATIINSGVVSVNDETGAIVLQGTNNRITLSKNGGTITLSTPQAIGTSSSPTFSSITLSNIGTQNGNTICDISNNCGYGGANSFVQNGNSFGASAVLGTNDNNSLALETNGTTRLLIANDGAAQFAGTVGAVGSDPTAPAYTMNLDSDTGFYAAAPNRIGFAAGGVTVATLDSARLDVAGRLLVGSDATFVFGVSALIKDSFDTNSNCNFGCYGLQSLPVVDNPTNNNGTTALYGRVDTEATVFTLPIAQGLFIADPNVGAGSDITTSYGIRVDDMTSAGTNYGIAIQGASTQALWIGSAADSTTANQGIALGLSRDTNLYRSAADTLRTDDTLSVGTDAFVGNSLQVGPAGNDIDECSVTTGTVDCTVGLEVVGSSTETTDISRGVSAGIQITAGAENTATNHGGYFGLGLAGTSDYSGNNIALSGTALVGTSSGTVSRIVGTEGQATLLGGAITTTVTEAFGLQSGASIFTTSGGTIDYAYGHYVNSATVTGAGASIDRAFGIYVNDQTAADSENYGVVIEGADTQTLWLANDIDSTSQAGGILFGQSADVAIYRSDANQLTISAELEVEDTVVTGVLTVDGHIVSGNTSGSTTIAVDTNGAGTGGTASISGNDTAGEITINTGTGAAADRLAVITFANAYGNAPNVVITPKDVPGTYPDYHFDSATGTFELHTDNALTDSVTYTFSYFVIE